MLRAARGRMPETGRQQLAHQATATARLAELAELVRRKNAVDAAIAAIVSRPGPTRSWWENGQVMRTRAYVDPFAALDSE